MLEQMKQFIAQAWGSSTPDRFPGPQPVSIERVHFQTLKSQPYLVCEKNDGVRNMLVCFEHEVRKYCLFVDRMFNFTYTTLPIPRGTILDGEMMDGTYLIYDAIMIRGEKVSHLPLTERLAMARKLCSTVLPTKGNVRLKVKQMLPLERVSEIQLGPDTDGLIFTPVNEPVRTGTHETCFKWKPKHLNTIDFIVRRDENGLICLFLQQGEAIKPLTKVCAQGKEPKEFEGKVVECEYGRAGWSIIKIRTDKDYPNNKRTYLRTLVNIKENIQLEDFAYIAK